jgi:hypothetical protein
MELLPMLTPESPEPEDIRFGGQVVSLDSDDELNALVVPRTIIDHLLSESDRLKAKQERKAFEAVGKRSMTDEEIYSLVYACARDKIAAGVSQDEIEAGMMLIASSPDFPNASIVRQAYEDVIAGRAPRFSLPF